MGASESVFTEQELEDYQVYLRREIVVCVTQLEWPGAFLSAILSLTLPGVATLDVHLC